MCRKLSFTIKYRPSGTELMLIASRLDRNAAVNISDDCSSAASTLRKLSAMRSCLSFVKMRRAVETKNDAVIAAQARVICSWAIRRLIHRTKSGMQTGRTRDKMVALTGGIG